MRSKLVAAAVLGTVALSTGCSTMAGTGALAGGGIGAGTGALIGAATGSPEAGAAIGGVLGAGIGSAVGAEADQKERDRADLRRVQAENAVPVRGPMSLDDVIAMSRPSQTGARVSDDVLIDYIRTSGSRFDLSPGDIRHLADNGVSDGVVRAMMNTKNAPPLMLRRQGPTTVIVDEPPPVVVYERPYYRHRRYWAPPPGPSFGFSYTRVR